MSAIALPRSTPPTAGHAGVLEGTRKRVLVVDDDPATLLLLTSVLRRLQLDVETCADPREALARLGSRTFDLVISDERMPHVSGTDVLRSVRARSPRTPTILVTGHARPGEDLIAYERAGVFDMLHKPWDNTELLERVSAALVAGEMLAP